MLKAGNLHILWLWHLCNRNLEYGAVNQTQLFKTDHLLQSKWRVLTPVPSDAL